MKIKGFIASILMGSAAVMAGCATSGKAPENFQNEDWVGEEYRIGPGDKLSVFVWNHPELSVALPVRPDGKISAPLVGEVPAVGKTPGELAKDIETGLAEYVRAPTVNVMVTEFVGAFSDQVRVIGQAAQPSIVPYRMQMTLLDVLVEVGGLTELAAGNRTRIIRRVDGKEISMSVKAQDLLEKGDMSQNVTLRPGDVVVVPQAIF